jgi:hypothetical protein
MTHNVQAAPVVQAPPVAPTLPVGGNTAATIATRTFNVLGDVKDFGLSENNNQRYWVKVQFKDGNKLGAVGAFYIYSHSLTDAFMQIELIGRKTKGLSQEDFNKSMTEPDGTDRTFWFNLTEDKKDKSHRVVAYRTDSHGQYLVYAFPKKVTRLDDDDEIFNQQIFEELERLSKAHRSVANGAVPDLSSRGVKVFLKQINNQP